MIIAACVDAQKLTRLRSALGDRHRLHVALDWSHAESIVRRQPIDVLVLDPFFGSTGTANLAPVKSLRSTFRSVPVVMYSALNASTMPPIIELGRDGVEQLVLYGVDDEPHHFRALLEQQPGVQLAEQLLSRLRPRLRTLSADVAGAIERVIHTPAAFKGVPDLAAAAKISRRTIYRECERANLASPREIIAGARIVRAYAFLREADYAIEDVAEQLRFSSPHHLTKTMRWATGMTTARARDRINPEDLVAMVAEKLLPAPGAPRAPDSDDDE